MFNDGYRHWRNRTYAYYKNIVKKGEIPRDMSPHEEVPIAKWLAVRGWLESSKFKLKGDLEALEMEKKQQPITAGLGLLSSSAKSIISKTTIIEIDYNALLPPGFRFHPTDEELITFYIASKVFNGTFCAVHIAEVDLNRCESWELPDVAKMGEREWYFFSLRDRKYPTGLRTNRATGAGYWKATGKDREVYSSTSGGGSLLGMKKTLVFYKGRAPRREKTKWVMHEYPLDGDFARTKSFW